MNALQQKLQQSHIKKEQNKEVAYNNQEQAIEMNDVASNKNKTVTKHRSKHSQVLMMVSSALDVGRESMMSKSKNKKGTTTDTTTFVPSPSTPLNVSIQSPTANTEDNKDNENEATTPVGFFDVDDEEEEEVEGIEENEIHKMENEILKMEEQLDKGMDSPSNVKEDLEERPKRRSRGEKIKGELKKKISSPLKRLSSVFGKKKKKKNEIEKSGEVAVEKSSPKKKKKKKKSGLKSGSKSQKKNDTQGRGSSGTFEDLEAKLARLEKLGR